jgi:type II secretory pathway component PulF
MALFRYKGLRKGLRQEDTFEADSLDDAREKLRREGWLVCEIRPAENTEGKVECVKKSADGDPGPLEKFFARLFISRGQWELSLRQMSALLQAGIPILSAFHAVEKQASPLLGRVYGRVIRKLRQGRSLQLASRKRRPLWGKFRWG